MTVAKLRESIKPRTRRNNGKSMEVIVAAINRTLKGWFGYFKHAHPSELEEIDRWMGVRLRSILGKRRGGQGRARGLSVALKRFSSRVPAKIYRENIAAKRLLYAFLLECRSGSGPGKFPRIGPFTLLKPQSRPG